MVRRYATTAVHHRFPLTKRAPLARDAARQLAQLPPDAGRPLRLVADGDKRESISIPPGAIRLLLDALTQLGQGRTVAVVPGKVELATQEVADYLNVSRSYVVKLIDSGKLPARLVGTRHHVSFADLIKFDEEDRKARRAALDELAQIDQELEL